MGGLFLARFYSYFAQGVQNPCKKRAFFYNNFAQQKTRANAYSTRFIKVFAVKILFNYIYKTIFKLTFSNLHCKKCFQKNIKLSKFQFFCVFPSTINKVFLRSGYYKYVCWQFSGKNNFFFTCFLPTKNFFGGLSARHGYINLIK